MRIRNQFKVFLLGIMLASYFVSAASAAFWDFSKKDEKKQAVEEKKVAKVEVKAEATAEIATTAQAPALASATAPAPSLEIVSPKGDAVSGKFHVEAKLTPDEGFDELFFRVMGDAVCEKDFKRGDKYEADCDTGKAANGTSFILQAQAFNKSKNAVVASFSKVMWVGKSPVSEEAVKDKKKKA